RSKIYLKALLESHNENFPQRSCLRNIVIFRGPNEHHDAQSKHYSTKRVGYTVEGHSSSTRRESESHISHFGRRSYLRTIPQRGTQDSWQLYWFGNRFEGMEKS